MVDEIFVDVDAVVGKPKGRSKGFVGLLIIGFLSVLGILLLIFLYFSSRAVPVDLLSIDDLSKSESISTTLRSQYQPDRDSYGLGVFNGKFFSVVDVFNDLPPVPEDFWRVKYIIMSGRASADTLCDLSSEYFVQPEFFSNSWVDSGLNIYKHPNPDHWTPEGYGTFPHVIEALSPAGSLIGGCTFFHSSWGVETYQGFKLVEVFPESFEYGGVSVSVNSSLSRQFLSLSFDDSDVLLYPAYLKFNPNWSQKVGFSVVVSPDAPAGLYAVGWDVSRADIVKASRWYSVFGELYQSISGVRVSEPQFVMVGGGE